MKQPQRNDFWINLFIRWIVTTLSIYGVAWLLHPHIQTDSFESAIWAGLVLGLINVFVRPLIVLLTLPATMLTMGLFLLLINAALLYLVGELVEGFEVESFGWAILASILISLVGTLLGQFFREKKTL